MKTTKTAQVVVTAILALGLTAGTAEAKEAIKKRAPAKSVSVAPAAAAKKDSMQVLRLYDFETDLDGWRIPEWQFQKGDNAVKDVEMSSDQASYGKQSLKVNNDFKAGQWTASYVEMEREGGNYMDWTGHNYVMIDVFLPSDAPNNKKIKGEIIITQGENWLWTEMRKPIELVPGQWTTLKADITPDGTDWKLRITDAVRSDVRKIGVRISSAYQVYAGPVYVDNVRLGSMAKK